MLRLLLSLSGPTCDQWTRSTKVEHRVFGDVSHPTREVFV